MRSAFLSAAVVVLMLAGMAIAEEVARPREESLDLPAAWQAVSPQVRLAATRVAEVDADRLLVERIYGVRINADTYVLDLALASDEVRGAVAHDIKGIRTTEVKYTDDLTVEVVREVTLREVIETITRTLRRTKGFLGVKEEELVKVSHETRDTVLGVMGNGAVLGSKGHRMIQAKRAAEMDAYRKLAERVIGVRITSETKVRDLVLESDEIATHLAASLKGAKTTDIVCRDDGSCEVTMRLILREVIETLKRSYTRYSRGRKVTEDEWKGVWTEVHDKVIKVTGVGAPRAEGMESVGIVSDAPFYQEVEIIRRVIKREVGAL